MRLASLLTGLGLLSVTGCFEDPPPVDEGGTSTTAMTPACDQGARGCPCFPNGTCNFDLACRQGLCEPAESSSSSSATTTTTAPDTAGSTTAGADTTTGTNSSSGTIGEPLVHILFTTSTSYTGVQVDGLDGADAQCNALGRGLRAGPWVAVLSDAVTAVSDRIEVRGEIRNTNGELLATGEDELLSGRLLAIPGYDEDGRAIPNSDLAWTGSMTADCNGWMVDDVALFGAVGLPTSTALWLDTQTPLPCSGSPRLYCLSQ
ncbi:MAG: hypothetical protein AAGF11_42105 [Myxococcota bacterium]